MQKNTFEVQKDHDGREFIIQVIKEFDKNHREDDMNEFNDARIYAIPDKYTFSCFNHTLN